MPQIAGPLAAAFQAIGSAIQAVVSASAAATFAATGSAAVAGAVSNFVAGALTLGTVGGGTAAALGAALSQAAAISLLSRALVGSPKVPNPGSQINFGPNPNAPRAVVFGKTATAGAPVAAATHGVGKHVNMLLTYISAVSAWGPIAGVDTIYLNDEEATFAGNGTPILTPGGPGSTSLYPGRLQNTQWRDYVFYQHKLGEWNQTAMVFNATPAPLPSWTAAHRGAGVAHTAFSYWNEPDKFSGGPPAPKLVVRGQRDIVNPVDLTVAYSEWPADIVYTMLRGITAPNGQRIGVGLTDDFIDRPALAAWRAVCVANNWRMGGIYYVDQQNQWEFLKAALQAGGASFCERNGKASVAFKAPKPVVYTITEDNLQDHPTEDNLPDVKTRVSRLVPKCWSPASKWQYNEVEAVSRDSYATQDGGVFSEPIEFPFVFQPQQARQLAAYELQDRRQPTVTLPCKPYMAGLPVDSLVEISLPEYGIEWPKALVIRNAASVHAGGEITLRFEPADYHEFALSFTATDQAAVVLPQQPVDVVPTPEGEATATPIQLTGDGGSQIPAIRVAALFSPSAVVRADFRIKPVSSTEWQTAVEVRRDTPSVDAGPLAPGTAYDVQARYVLASGAASAWVALPRVGTGGVVASDALPRTIYKLYPDEKDRTVVPRVESLRTAASGLIIQANDWGIDVTALENAITDLDTYLEGLPGPVDWDDRSDFTTVAPSNFIGTVFEVWGSLGAPWSIGPENPGLSSKLVAVETQLELMRTALAIEAARRAEYALIPDAPPAEDVARNNARVRTRDPVFPISAATTTTFTIDACSIVFEGRPSEDYPSGSVTGLTAGTLYGVFRDRDTNTYVAYQDPSASMTSAIADPVRYVLIGAQFTELSGGGFPSPPPPPTPPSGGLDPGILEKI